MISTSFSVTDRFSTIWRITCHKVFGIKWIAGNMIFEQERKKVTSWIWGLKTSRLRVEESWINCSRGILIMRIEDSKLENSSVLIPPWEKLNILSLSSFFLNGITALVKRVDTLLEQEWSNFRHGVSSSASLIRHVSIERTIPLKNEIKTTCILAEWIEPIMRSVWIVQPDVS